MSIKELEQMAATIRCDIIEMICTAQAGHPGGSLSATDIVTALYFRIMQIDPENPQWLDRDRFILSKGHACPVWYAALAERGYFDKSHLGTLRQLNSILQGHPDMHKTPGIDMTAGSLGHGLSAGVGMALSGKLQKKEFNVWIVIGDGESQEGSIWEA
ncbi:MAG: transketolase, partial [Desulfobacterales bacterium]|nr:transketolase [Desulfobacterales bacterium]